MCSVDTPQVIRLSFYSYINPPLGSGIVLFVKLNRSEPELPLVKAC